MAYNNNIPLPRDRYRISQGDILQNFQAIDTVTQVNHILFNDADQGKHKFVQFPRQVTSPTTGGTEVAVYSQSGFSDSVQPNPVTALFFKRSSGTEINFTDTFIATRTFGLLPNQLSAYWNRLPSGLLIKIGSIVTNVNPNNNTFTPPERLIRIPAGPNFNNIYWVNITPQRDPTINPNSSNADPNIVIYITQVNVNGMIGYRAWTRNLFDTPRQQPKTDVLLRLTIIGD